MNEWVTIGCDQRAVTSDGVYFRTMGLLMRGKALTQRSGAWNTHLLEALDELA
jgi:hypothetical protein